MAAVLAPPRRRSRRPEPRRFEANLLGRVLAERYPTYEQLLIEVYGRRRKSKTTKGAAT